MTNDDKEFLRLLETFKASREIVKNLEASLPSKPEYESDEGFITPTSIAIYKKQLAEYEGKKTALDQGKTDVKAALDALADYLTPPVMSKLEQGVALFAEDTNGVVGVLNKRGEYFIIHGRSRDDVRNQMSRIPPY